VAGPVEESQEAQSIDPEALAARNEAAAVAVDEVRRVIASLRKTKAPPELLRACASELEEIATRLAPFDHPGPYAQGGLEFSFSSPGGERPTLSADLNPAEFFPYSPVVGPLNAVAPPIRFERQGEELVAEHVFDAQYCGPPTAVHGGIIALVFDELLGSTNVINQLGAFTGTLKVVYRSLTPVGEPIRMRAWIEERSGRKIRTRGTMHFGDRLCAEADAIFITADVLAAVSQNKK